MYVGVFSLQSILISGPEPWFGKALASIAENDWLGNKFPWEKKCLTPQQQNVLNEGLKLMRHSVLLVRRISMRPEYDLLKCSLS